MRSEKRRQPLKIAIVANQLHATWLLRRGVIMALRERGHSVYAITPPDRKYGHLIGEIGAVSVTVPLGRYFSPWLDLRYIWRLYRILRKERFDIVHTYTIKPNIFGPLAARAAGIKTVLCSVTGLGYLFSDDAGFKLRMLRSAGKCLMRTAFRCSRAVSFQNPDNLEFMVSSRLLNRDKAVLIRSSGVDLQAYSIGSVDKEKMARLKSKLRKGKDTVMVCMVARATWLKGVKEFMEACDSLSKRRRNVIFLFVGQVDETAPGGVPVEYFREEVRPNFRRLGFIDDIPEIMALSDIVVLPSHYREGTPNTLLEAMAMGKPVVTTDTAGCREVVDDGKSGYLVPVKDGAALADKIDALVMSSEKRRDFGKQGRLKAEREFDVHKVVQETLEQMYGFE